MGVFIAMRSMPQCSGDCVVCKGVVVAGPTSLSAQTVDRLLREEECCYGCCEKTKSLCVVM